MEITTKKLLKALSEAKVKVYVTNKTHYFGENDYEYECEVLESVHLYSEDKDGVIVDGVYFYENGDGNVDGFVFKKGREYAKITLSVNQRCVVLAYLISFAEEINEGVEELISNKRSDFLKGFDISNDEDNITSIYESI